MNVIRRPADSLTTEHFDTEMLAFLETAPVELPDGLDITAAVAAIETRMLAARDITATDPTATELVRERLVDVFLPRAPQLRITRPAAATALAPLAA